MAKVEILNNEQDEVVGTVDTDQNLDAENEALKIVSQEYIEYSVVALVSMTYESEDGETVYADAEVVVGPVTTGFVRTFVDEPPSPFDCNSGAHDGLLIHEEEQ